MTTKVLMLQIWKTSLITLNWKISHMLHLIASYCQHLKMLYDQLSDVDQSVSDQQLVIQLINGLSRDYVTIDTIINNTSPLPLFDTTRSMLLREETRRGRHSDNQALVAPTTPSIPNPPNIFSNN